MIPTPPQTGLTQCVTYDHARMFVPPFLCKMAAGGVPDLGGYEYEFVGEIADDWECLVCQLPLKDPVQIEKCGHRLCEICVATILR